NLGVVVLLVPLKNHRPGTGQVFIATGRGAEGFLTDAQAGRIRDAMVPYLARADYGAGLTLGVQLIAQAFAREFGFTRTGEPPPPPEETDRLPIPAGLVIAVVVLLIIVPRGRILWWIFVFSRFGGGVRGGRPSGTAHAHPAGVADVRRCLCDRVRRHPGSPPAARRPRSLAGHRGAARACATPARARVDGQAGAAAPSLCRAAGTPETAGAGDRRERRRVLHDAAGVPASGRQDASRPRGRVGPGGWRPRGIRAGAARGTRGARPQRGTAKAGAGRSSPGGVSRGGRARRRVRESTGVE